MIVEAMRQALEAMELEMKGYAAKHDRLMPAAHALRTAIAKAEKQEPHELLCLCGATWCIYADSGEELVNAPPAAQRQWVGFTDEEINEYDYEHRDFIYDIEALLKHKNTRLG